MADINEIDFDDEFLDDPQYADVEKNKDDNINPPENKEEYDLTQEVLRLKGIQDPSKIKFEDETGTIIERSWDNLSKEEQLHILLDNEDTNDLNQDELDLINTIRDSGMNVQDYINSLTSTTIPEEKSYKVDSLSDEDLYALDLLEKVGSDNISDEELTAAIEAAKQNEDLFKKTVEGIRKEYIRLQEDEENQAAQQQALKQEQEYQQFSNTIKNEINNLNSFMGQELSLSKDDIEQLSDFILNLDEQGMSTFGKAMNDPKLFTKAAFWLLNEEKLIEELNKQMQYNYTRGYNDAKKDYTNVKPSNSKLVFNTNQQKPSKDQEFVDDDEWD